MELAPERAPYWNVLGMTFGGQGHLDKAEAAFRRALTLDPRNYEHSYNLGLLLLRQERLVEARGLFEKSVALQPRFAPAHRRLAEIDRQTGAR